VPAEAKRAIVRPLVAWLRRPTVVPVFVFILLYKLADASMGPMVKPFWVDRGLSPAEIGAISTTVGVIATIIGAILGGLWVNRWGIFSGLWALGLLQAGSNLGYFAVAQFDLPRGFLYAASVFESFSGGLGTAAFMSFLMNICEKEHAAVQYALLSAIFGFSRSVAGGVSGWGAERLGYASYFGLTFLLAFPAYALLPWVRSWIRERGTEPAVTTSGT
jgi:PAT family beta-lactamase induction signal transducer AmpG